MGSPISLQSQTGKKVMLFFLRPVLFLLIFLASIFSDLCSQEFTEQTGISLTAVGMSSVAWGDYDNDGDLDILLTGSDFDGSHSHYFSKIYKNNGDNTFTEQTDITLTGVTNSSAVWGDYNNYGYLDILLTGYYYDEFANYISKIYKNNGDNTFTEQTGISLIGVRDGSTAWGDYDNDGDLDILLTGSYSIENACVSKIYKNNGDNTFITEQSGSSLTGVYKSSVAWGDYDNDGDLDILLTGQTGSEPASNIYQNNGDNTFSEQSEISLTGVYNSSVAWGDYDNDGDLDILLTGIPSYGSKYVSKIYQNNGDNIFIEQTGISLKNVGNSSIAWGDYDNDADLDILLTGYIYELSDYISKIYKNNSVTSNTSPSPPQDLLNTVNKNSVILSWNKSSDNETPRDGLSYNAYIYSESGNTIWSCMSDINSGFRRIPAIGNVQYDTSWTIRNLSPGKYFWSVQSIDNSYISSPFAAEDSFTIRPASPVVLNQTICFGDPVPSLTAVGENIKWYSDAELTNLEYEGNTFNTNKEDPGVYHYYVTQSITNIESSAREVTLTINQLPVTNILNDLPYCESTVVPIYIGSESTQGHSYSWSSDPTGFTSSQANPAVLPTENTTYILVETIDSTGCQKSDSVTLTLRPNPVVSLSAEQDTIDQGGNVVLNAYGADNYQWSPSNGLISTNGSQVTASPMDNTTYVVNGTNEYGCEGYDSLQVFVYCPACEDKQSLFIPGKFSYGCGTRNLYKNNLYCSWTLYPDNISEIYLFFNPETFDIKPGDWVIVYNSSQASEDTLGKFNNDHLPSGNIEGGSTMFVELITDDSITGTGFQAEWSGDPSIGMLDPEEQNFRIYPNPSNGMTTIKFYSPQYTAEIELFNTTGQKVLQRKVFQKNGYFIYHLDVTEMQEGIYYLRFITGRGVISKMLIVQ